ncbi:MAG: ABC transporter substrate-binding protein [Schaedlerella sp.]|nr:ABC transporter substrate-binding protein [Schaedlerella sp.]
MKKKLVSLLLALSMTACLFACGETETAEETTTEETSTEDKELTKVTWNYGGSGNVLVTIANEKGYFAEEGIEIETVEATANADAMALLASGKVNVVSNSGTSNPLQQIANGVDITVFGGHMVEGCMPVIAKAGTEWNGIESFIGESVAVNPSYFAFTGAVMDLGYEDPLDEEVVDWKVYSNYDDALVAVQKGEVKYALQGTQNNYGLQELIEAGEIEIVSYQSEIMENYSCCRMVAQTEWVNENPDTVKAILRALLRAQSYYEANKEEAVELHAELIGQEPEYVAAYMMDDEHYFVNVDPLKNGVVRAWGILDATGYLGEDCQIDILEHINTDLYEEALAEATELYGEEAPEFYEAQLKFFEENNK